jgi:hypothetical protein
MKRLSGLETRDIPEILPTDQNDTVLKRVCFVLAVPTRSNDPNGHIARLLEEEAEV